jgi:hypothetical protein
MFILNCYELIVNSSVSSSTNTLALLAVVLASKKLQNLTQNYN